ncbi:golgi complex component 7-domain-containing protein [Phanerochaete sordida]|uniref:Conserved oligomeric Golgi complex subunit 7 n=1 Tax=Phanerochaete sordida TaxID=48140 RepID=A0A9P3L933_9APHY|nr:golgi complex component 7-domain-containing protein [Phanerochaete sordida]
MSLTTEELLESLENHEDVVSWINDILDVDETFTSPTTQPAALGDLDRRVTQLVGTLELASEDTTTQVERLIDDISRGASRLTYDLHFMREGALSLQALLHNVETKSKASVAADTNAALDRLHFLDTVKHNMEAAREVLKEAESWSTLESDVISLLGEQNYERAAERLSEASKSMVVFEGTPEYDARRTLMVSLQNQLEAALSSALVAAVNSQDVAVCRNYFAIFCNIQRESEFRNYYYGSRKAALLEQWQRARLRDCDADAGDGAPTLAQFLPAFFQAFLAMLQTERTAIAAIFPDPQSTLATLITATLSSLQPSVPERLAAAAAHHGAAALPQLVAAYQAAQEFALATDRILEKIGFAAQPAPAPGDGDASAGRGHLRRRSSARMSISRRVGPHRASISGHPLAAPGDAAQPAWDQELFEPFLDFQNDYGSWEHRCLTDALRGIMREEPGPAQDRARLVRERAVDVVSAADEAIARCMAFTHGYAAAGLVEALDTFLRTFVDNSNAEISSAQTSPAMASASGDLSDLDYTPKDWADIQSLLHTLEAIRDLHDCVLKFEGKLRGSLVQLSHTFRLMRADPAGLHISGTTRGAVQLLAQSSLNSMELHDLLERVDPDLHTQSQSRGDPFLTPTPPASGAEARRPSQVFHLTPGPTQAAPLLVGARDAISGFAKACQVALQETILAPLRKRLAGYPSSPVWVAQADARRRGAGAGAGAAGSALSEVHVPTFSLSPTDTMQRVAEGLLNLPRLFEVYADDDALAFSLETLPHIGAELLRALAEPAPEAAAPHAHARRASSLSLKSPPAPAAPPELTPEAVSAAWLASLGRSLLAHLTAQVLPAIRFLSASGAAQLASDLGYLASIVMALNIEDAALERWKEYVELDDAAGRERLREGDAGDAVLATVARLRGWTTA